MLASYAAVICDTEKLWPSICAYPLPFLNLDFTRPTRFAAVYFPAWFITGEVEASVSYKGVQVRSIPDFLISNQSNPFSSLQVNGRAWFNNTCVNHVMLRTAFSSSLGKCPLVISQVSFILSLHVSRLF